MLKKLLNTLKNPKVSVIIVSYAVTLAMIAGVVLSFAFADNTVFWQIISYTLYALSAISLTYSIYTVVIFAPKWKKAIVSALHKNRFTSRLIESYGYRTVVFAVGAFAFGIAYGMFLCVLCIKNKSVWYGVLSGFYILMSFSRIIVVFTRKKGANNDENGISYAKTHRNCGILLIISALALGVAVLQMFFLERGFSYSGTAIYVAAIYAFYKITSAIINLVKQKSSSDLTLLTVRNINLVDAMFSILALQSALLSTFGEENTVNNNIFNAITGTVICTLTLTLGIIMIVTSTKKLRQTKE